MPCSTKSTPRPDETFPSALEKAKSSSKREIPRKTAEQLKDENFRRQNIKLAEKGDRLRTFDADVFMLVRRKGKLTIYTSRTSLEDPQAAMQRGQHRHRMLPMLASASASASRRRSSSIRIVVIASRRRRISIASV
jgi:hypothetical protein